MNAAIFQLIAVEEMDFVLDVWPPRMERSERNVIPKKRKLVMQLVMHSGLANCHIRTRLPARTAVIFGLTAVTNTIIIWVTPWNIIWMSSQFALFATQIGRKVEMAKTTGVEWAS